MVRGFKTLGCRACGRMYGSDRVPKTSLLKLPTFEEPEMAREADLELRIGAPSEQKPAP